MAFGTKADLARMLGISRAAVSQAFKRHGLQESVDKKFDLDYYAWLLSKKQNENIVKAQRSAKKQPAGVNNPRVRREIVRQLGPVWEEAVTLTLQDLVNDADADAGVDYDQIEEHLVALALFWHHFHSIFNEACPGDLADVDFEKPVILYPGAWPIMIDDIQKQAQQEKPYASELPPEKLEALVIERANEIDETGNDG